MHTQRTLWDLALATYSSPRCTGAEKATLMMLQEVALIVLAFFPDFGIVFSNHLGKRSLLSSYVYENSLEYPEKELFEANQTQYSSSIQPS